MNRSKKILKNEKIKLAGHVKAIQTLQASLFKACITPVIGGHFNHMIENNVEMKLNMSSAIQKISEIISKEKNECFEVLSEIVYSDEVGKVEIDQEALGKLVIALKNFVTLEFLTELNENYDSKKENFELLKEGVINKFENKTKTKLKTVISNVEDDKGVELNGGN